MYQAPGGRGRMMHDGPAPGPAQGGWGQPQQAGPSVQDLHGIIVGLQDQVKSQAAQIIELQQGQEYMASKQDLFQFRQELMTALDGRGMGVAPVQQAPAPAPATSGRYVPPGRAAATASTAGPEAVPESNPYGDNVAMSAVDYVLDEPTPAARGPGGPQFEATTRGDEMRRRIQNAFEAVAQKLRMAPDPSMDEKAWMREMKKMDSGIDLNSLQPVQDLPQFMRSMEKEGVIKWSRASGDGLLPFPLPSMDMFGLGDSPGGGGGGGGGRGVRRGGGGGRQGGNQNQGGNQQNQQGQQGQQGPMGHR